MTQPTQIDQRGARRLGVHRQRRRGRAVAAAVRGDRLGARAGLGRSLLSLRRRAHRRGARLLGRRDHQRDRGVEAVGALPGRLQRLARLSVQALRHGPGSGADRQRADRSARRAGRASAGDVLPEPESRPRRRGARRATSGTDRLHGRGDDRRSGRAALAGRRLRGAALARTLARDRACGRGARTRGSGAPLVAARRAALGADPAAAMVDGLGAGRSRARARAGRGFALDHQKLHEDGRLRADLDQRRLESGDRRAVGDRALQNPARRRRLSGRHRSGPAGSLLGQGRPRGDFQEPGTLDQVDAEKARAHLRPRVLCDRILARSGPRVLARGHGAPPRAICSRCSTACSWSRPH